MATRKQTQAAKRTIGKAQRAARSKRTIAKLPNSREGRSGSRPPEAAPAEGGPAPRSRTAIGRSSTNGPRS
jgi:hypothetical protein